jgi:hypothetical protein
MAGDGWRWLAMAGDGSVFVMQVSKEALSWRRRTRWAPRPPSTLTHVPAVANAKGKVIRDSRFRYLPDEFNCEG